MKASAIYAVQLVSKSQNGHITTLCTAARLFSWLHLEF